MLKPYIIRQGDYFTKLAHTKGFNAEKAWNDPANDDLRKKRSSMDMLEPGDIVFIPDEARPRLDVSGGVVNHYIARIPKIPVNVRIKVGGEIVVDEPYIIRGVGPDPVNGKTDKNGYLSTRVRVHVREIEVELPKRKRTLRVRVGDMDPMNELSGLQKRLTHLGYYLPTKTGTENFDALDPHQILSALKAFQAARKIEVTGKLDDKTRKALFDDSEGPGPYKPEDATN
jgi:Putative peptidoglycan binding domain